MKVEIKTKHNIGEIVHVSESGWWGRPFIAKIMGIQIHMTNDSTWIYYKLIRCKEIIAFKESLKEDEVVTVIENIVCKIKGLK